MPAVLRIVSPSKRTTMRRFFSHPKVPRHVTVCFVAVRDHFSCIWWTNSIRKRWQCNEFSAVDFFVYPWRCKQLKCGSIREFCWAWFRRNSRWSIECLWLRVNADRKCLKWEFRFVIRCACQRNTISEWDFFSVIIYKI